MIRKDYIMRMIEQLARALGKIMGFKNAGHYKEALEEIKKSGELFVGLDAQVIETSSDTGLIALLRRGHSGVDLVKCLALAELLKEQGEIYELQHEPDKSYGSYVKSLSLFLEATAVDKKSELADYAPKVDFIVGKLAQYELPERVMRKLFGYYETTGRYADAEDVLHELIETNESEAAGEGVAFYERLLTRPDDELTRGNLPRDEVAEALQALRERLSV